MWKRPKRRKFYLLSATLRNSRRRPYENTWSREELRGGSERIRIAARGDQVDLMLRLARLVEPPYYVLLVMQDMRAEVAPGRYQSPQLTMEEASRLLTDYREFLEGDARHNVWLGVAEGDFQVVYDEHDLMYAYGDLDIIARELEAAGFTEGSTEVPFPHTHMYRTELDAMAAELAHIEDFWLVTPLTEADEQE